MPPRPLRVTARLPWPWQTGTVETTGRSAEGHGQLRARGACGDGRPGQVPEQEGKQECYQGHEERRAGGGGQAHPHLVVDQVEDGVVGDPVQGKVDQPLLQRLQQLPDRCPAGEQLSKEGPTLGDRSGKCHPRQSRPWGPGPGGVCLTRTYRVRVGEAPGVSLVLGGSVQSRVGGREGLHRPPARTASRTSATGSAPSQGRLPSDRRHGPDVPYSSHCQGPCGPF